MYDSNARYAAVKIPSCCLSEKWRIINLFDDSGCFYEVESLGSWRKAAVGQVWLQSSELLHSIVSRLWRQFQTTGTAIRFSSDRPRGTTPADYRYIVLQARSETGGRQREEIARHTTQATGHNRYRVLPWPEECTVVVVCLHDALYGCDL
ncbi:hypothetical protein TNCV_535641 [Trichonephila clavipes]|nr:hypothetical protein TNCV_535641 [Trichonephila clavipes]